MAGVTKYNGIEASNINLGQAGVDIFENGTAKHFPSGECKESIASHTTQVLCDSENIAGGVCDEAEGTHTTKTLCDNENGGLNVHTTDPGLPIHWDYDQHTYASGILSSWKPYAKGWASVMIIGVHATTGSSVTLTPSIGDTVVLTYDEQVTLKGVKISGPWRAVTMGGTDSKIICYRS